MQISTRAIKFISLAVLLLYPQVGSADWTIDFSRRMHEMKNLTPRQDVLPEKKASATEPEGIFARSVVGTEPSEEIVILNTAQGFVPSSVRVVAGRAYKFIVVNVNETQKNISFILDSFSEHHATYYGQLKSFVLAPERDGVFTFTSPETSAKGRLIVQPNPNGSTPVENLRTPASVQAE